MRFGEVCLMTGQVRKLADFYKAILMVDNGSNDDRFQEILGGEVRLSVFSDGSVKNNNNTNIGLTFDVEDIDVEYERLKQLKVHFIEKPHDSAWGGRSMQFYDPDGNHVFFRSK